MEEKYPKETLHKVYLMLKTAIDLLKESQSDPCRSGYIPTFQDSVARRFLFCYECTQKHLNEALESEGIKITSPKKAFLACQQQGLLSDAELAIFLEATDAHKIIARGYDELAARTIANEIIETYYPTMQKVIERIIHSNS